MTRLKMVVFQDKRVEHKTRVMGSYPKDTNAFSHSGYISKLKGDSVIVSLDENPNCDRCRAKSVCGISDAPNKEVEIFQAAGSFKPKQRVEVVLKKSLGHKAVFWAYIFPFLLMVLTLLTASMFLVEWMAGILSVAILGPYYLLIYALSDYFKKTFRISLVLN
jgi:sigma-E factor negative regulatory protein RseC